MKTHSLWAAIITMGLLSTAEAQDKSVLKDQKDKVSYSIGLKIGSDFKQQSLELNVDALALGIKDVLSNGKPLLTEAEVQETLMTFQKEMMAKQIAQADKSKKAGETFLAENKKKEGVKTLPSGLQYKVIKEGKGKKPKTGDTVKAHYKGTLIDGKEFDSTDPKGDPASFGVSQVIPGWTEALQLMSVGSKWQLFVPSNLGYGEQGQGPIPANSTLIFEVELVGIEEPKK
jgi:FKBP-type peptidyl-prolyl cis-trans isomerase